MSEAQLSRDQVKDYLKNLSLIDAAALVKELEAELGVSAAAPVAAAAAPAAGGAAAAAPEKEEFNVVLTGSGDKKIQVIKVVRELTGLGLKEAKDLVEGGRKAAKEGATKAEAKEIKKRLEAAGGRGEFKKEEFSFFEAKKRTGEFMGRGSDGAREFHAVFINEAVGTGETS